MIYDYWTIFHTDTSEFESDPISGKVYYFSTTKEAENYIKEHELENVEILPQW